MREGVLTSNPLALRRYSRRGKTAGCHEDSIRSLMAAESVARGASAASQRDEMGLIVRCGANARKGVRLPWERRRLAGI